MAGINEVLSVGAQQDLRRRFSRAVVDCGRVFTLEQIKSLPKELLRSSALHSFPD